MASYVYRKSARDSQWRHHEIRGRSPVRRPRSCYLFIIASTSSCSRSRTRSRARSPVTRSTLNTAAPQPTALALRKSSTTSLLVAEVPELEPQHAVVSSRCCHCGRANEPRRSLGKLCAEACDFSKQATSRFHHASDAFRNHIQGWRRAIPRNEDRKGMKAFTGRLTMSTPSRKVPTMTPSSPIFPKRNGNEQILKTSSAELETSPKCLSMASFLPRKHSTYALSPSTPSPGSSPALTDTSTLVSSPDLTSTGSLGQTSPRTYHYRDLEARLLLRKSIATFDDALQFGFPTRYSPQPDSAETAVEDIYEASSPSWWEDNHVNQGRLHPSPKIPQYDRADWDADLANLTALPTYIPPSPSRSGAHSPAASTRARGRWTLLPLRSSQLSLSPRQESDSHAVAFGANAAREPTLRLTTTRPRRSEVC